MSNPKKAHELIRQNEQIVKKSQKHDANLQKNSTIYFQIGLIVCLLAVYGLFEMTFKTNINDYGGLPSIEEPTYVEIPVIKIKVPEFVEPIEQKKAKASSDFIEVSNDTPLDLLKVDLVPKKDMQPQVNPSDLVLVETPALEEDVDFIRIEQVPIYPGCENQKTNDDKRKCMSEKITKLVQRKFDTELASDLGLTGKQVIHTQFKIDNKGHVMDIKTRAPHPKLEEEAARVINTLPEMAPGKQRDKPVGVIYNLPIVFEVQ